MKIKCLCIALCAAVGMTAFTGCTSYNKKMAASEKMFYSGKYKDAARSLLPGVNQKSVDQLLLTMECGLMLHAAQDYATSNKVLLEAASIADKIPVSVTQQIGSLLTNDTNTNYRGEDFERVLIHMYIGINFIMLGNPDEARVEFKKVNDMLNSINTTGGKAYKQNVMAKYLTAIAFELIADRDRDESDREFAYIEYKQIYQLDPRLALVYRDLQRISKKMGDNDDYAKWIGQFGKRDNISADAGELVMIFQAGQSAIKVSRGKLLSDVTLKNSIQISLNGMPLQQGVTIAGVMVALAVAENPIPRFQKRSNKIDHMVININGNDVDQTYMLENIEDTAVKNMEDDYGRMYAKVAAGIAVKAVAVVATQVAAKKIAEQSKKTSGVAGLIGAAAGAAMGVGLGSQIKPDLRCWHTLPANLQLGRIFLPPGKYNVVIKFIDKNGAVERTETQPVEIKKGQKFFLNYRTLY